MGGEWIHFAKGKTLVGVDEDDVDFNTVEKELGEKTHKLTAAEMPSHRHYGEGSAPAVAFYNWMTNEGNKFAITNSGGYPVKSMDNAGGDQAHNNIQPSITVYFWKRVA